MFKYIENIGSLINSVWWSLCVHDSIDRIAGQEFKINIHCPDRNARFFIILQIRYSKWIDACAKIEYMTSKLYESIF